MEWRIYVCSSCDEDDPFRFVQPMRIGASHDASPDLGDFCPRCESHLPFTEMGVGEILVIQRTKGYGDIPYKPEGST